MGAIWFWLAAAGMTLGVTALLLLALWRGRAAAEGAEPAAAFDLRVYRDQLREVDRDVARGVIGPEDAERLRTEIARRVLEADRALKAAGGRAAMPQGARLAAAAGIAAILLAGSFLTYRSLGAPGYPDLPLAARIDAADRLRDSRPRQDAAEAQHRAAALPPGLEAPDPRHVELVTRLREVVAQRPDDLRGQELLARNEAALGNYDAARRAQAQVIALKGPAATVVDHATHAELMILATGGYVSPEAEAALAEVLRRDPSNGFARYYTGLMFAQVGRFDMAFRVWRPLVSDSRAEDPWTAALRAQVEQVAARAGVDYTMPPIPTGPRGPSAEQVEAAGELTPEARLEMVRAMVAGLNERLAAEGGSADDWARLIRAYGVLGDRGAARAIWAEAAVLFAAEPGALLLVQAAARDAGVSE